FLAHKSHDVLDTGTIVPAAVKDHDFACCRELLDVSLGKHLSLLPLRRRGEGDNSEDPWTYPLGHSPDGAAFTCRVASFEQYDDPQAFLFGPFLQPAQLDLKLAQFGFIILALHPLRTITTVLGALAFIFAHESGSRP